MSEDNNVGKVSRRLQQKRFSAKYRHTKNFREYDAEMWNSNDIQFLAFSQKSEWYYDSFKRRHLYPEIRLHFFGWDYHYWTLKKENKLARPITGIHVALRPEKAVELREFLVQKPTDETFILPWGRGEYHLSFEKRSLFSGIELKWRFFNNKKEWDNSLFLPRGERKKERRKLKVEEVRRRLWFADDQSDKLIAYLDSVIPSYTFLK